MEPLPCYILAGGRNRRFGSDKARAAIDHQPLITHQLSQLRGLVEPVTVVAEWAEKYADLQLRTIADARPHEGPLVGLATAIDDRVRQLGAGWLLLTSCDRVITKPVWVQHLFDHIAGEHQAIAYRDGDRWEPLLALYHTSVGGAIEAVGRSGKASLQRLLDAVDALALEKDADWPELTQANTPQQLESLIDSLGR